MILSKCLTSVIFKDFFIYSVGSDFAIKIHVNLSKINVFIY
jgi:hypothetical protein